MQSTKSRKTSTSFPQIVRTSICAFSKSRPAPCLSSKTTAFQMLSYIGRQLALIRYCFLLKITVNAHQPVALECLISLRARRVVVPFDSSIEPSNAVHTILFQSSFYLFPDSAIRNAYQTFLYHPHFIHSAVTFLLSQDPLNRMDLSFSIQQFLLTSKCICRRKLIRSQMQ